MEKLNRKTFILKAAQSAFEKKKTVPDGKAGEDFANKELPSGLGKASSGIGEYTGVWGEAQIRHLLRRTLFGYSKSDFDFFKTLDLDACISQLLNFSSALPAPPLNDYSQRPNQQDADVPYGQTWINAPVNLNVEGARIMSFKAWTAGLLVNQDRNIREKMTLFWHHHFATETFTVLDARYVYRHHSLLRQSCLGNFKALVKAVTIDPAMLRYLNGYANTKNAPDENYARELQELFTIGKDLPLHYTEDDVKQAARVLTGWRDNRVGISSYFDASKHDQGDKTFSAFYGNTKITGRTGSDGANETDDMLTMIFAHDEVAKFICRKLYRFFVYYLIDDTTELQVIVPLAQIFRNSNYEIRPVIEALLKSEHFYDALNSGCMIKPPLDHVIGMCRQMNVKFPAPGADTSQIYDHWLVLEQYCSLMQQDYGDPPNVAGWPAYWENPQYYELWINSDSLSKRNLLADYLLYAGYDKSGFTLIFDCTDFASRFNTPGDPGALINQVIPLFYVNDLSQQVKDGLKVAFLLTGQVSDHYWTDAWNSFMANPTDVNLKMAVNIRLQGLLKYLFGQAEYQLS